MGRKYKELKAALKANPVRSLLVVDDWGLRLRQFSEAETLLKKIDKANHDQEQFVTQDQRLFNDWYELTFRKEKQEMEERHREYITLAQFHNDLISVVEMEELSLHEAYWYLQDEQTSYNNGSDQDRKAIENRRQQRREYAQKAMDQEWNTSFGDSEDGDDPEPESPSFDEPDLGLLTKSEYKTYHFLKSSASERLQNYFSGSDSKLLALEALGIISKANDQLLFLKVWQSLSSKTQKALSKDFKRDTGQNIEDIVQELDDINNSQDGAGENDSNEDFFEVPRQKTQTLSPLEEESLKILYRKLARVIHPDSHDPLLDKQLKNWFNKIWLRVQEAYRGKDLLLLQRLEILTTLRLKKLNTLTIDEIKTSTRWLEAELSLVQRTLKDMKKHPAWGFSRKRSFDSLIARIKKDFAKGLAPILSDIERLKHIHNPLKKPLQKTRQDFSKKRRRGKAPKRQSKKTQQMSFFD